MKQPLEFNLQGQVLPITLTQDGKELVYELREMTAASRDKYLDQLGGRLRVDPEGRPVGVKKFDGMQADLLALCLWDQARGAYITKDELQKWPASVVSAIYGHAQEMHRLPGEDEPVKNE